MPHASPSLPASSRCGTKSDTATQAAPRSTHTLRPPGFTMIELSVVLVIIGVIMFAGIASWSTIVAGQRINSTRAEMENIKRCLINRVMYSDAFPTWDLTGMNCNTPRSQFDVEHCLCGRTDAWGNAIRYIAGLEEGGSSGLGQNATHYIVTNEPQGRGGGDITKPSPANSQVNGTDGMIQSVAFVLLSYGSDRQPDPDSADPNETYGPLFDGDLTAGNQPVNRIGDFIVGAPDPTRHPNFSNTRNDLYLVVTSYELASMLRR